MVKQFKWLLALSSTAVLFSGSAMAQTFNLVGSWSGDITIVLESEGKVVESARSITFVIEKVDGNRVYGHRTWRSRDGGEPGYVGDTATTQASENFIGTVSSDGDTLRLVEIEDRGIVIGEVLSRDEIEFTYMETAPHAVAYTGVYRRQ